MLFQILLVALISCLTYIYFQVARKQRLFQSMGLEADPGTFPLGSEPIWTAVTKGVTFNRAFDKQNAKFGNKGKAKFSFLVPNVVI